VHAILILSHSSSIALVCRHLRAVTNSAPPSVRARYLISSHLEAGHSKWIFAHALQFPICNLEVFVTLERIWGEDNPTSRRGKESIKPVVDLDSGLWNLPKRLFRAVPPCLNVEPPEPSPSDSYHLLAHILDRYPFNADSYSGYPLSMAVRAPHIPLIRLLLKKNARPGLKEGLAIRIAISKRSLELVKMLIERTPVDHHKKKRRKLEDRAEVNGSMLQLAVKVDARDIVEYLMVKGCVPDMKTLKMVG